MQSTVNERKELVMNKREYQIFGMDEVNESSYVVRGSLEVDWSKGKSCMQHRKEKLAKPTDAKPKAYIKYPIEEG